VNTEILFSQIKQRIGFVVKGYLMLGALLLAAPVQSQEIASGADKESQQSDLVVHAGGFLGDKGHAVADLFVEGEDVFGKPHVRVVADIRQGQATLTFPQMKYGSYAVRVFHDENGNNALDHNMLSFPAEPLGFSNGFKLGVFSGLPTFAKLRTDFAAGGKPLEIVVK